MKESKNKKWLWVINYTLTKPDDTENWYTYRTHSMYGTYQQVLQDFTPQIEQALTANGWTIAEEKYEREDSKPDALKFINGVSGKIVKK